MTKVRRRVERFIFIFIGIILISALPSALYQINQDDPSYRKSYLFAPNFSGYFNELTNLFSQLIRPSEWTIPFGEREYPFLSILADKYVYSMIVFISSLLIGIILASILAMIVSKLSTKLKRLVHFIMVIFESLPDVFIILSLQLIAISLYKQYKWLPFNIVSVYDDRAYFLPILCLSLLPTIYLFKTTILLLKEEEFKPYIDLAKAKGLKSSYILINHIFRNVLFNLFLRARNIFVFMLSNLFILDIVLNMNGVMNLLLRSEGIIFVLTIFSIAIPFYLLFTLIEILLFKFTGEIEGDQHV